MPQALPEDLSPEELMALGLNPGVAPDLTPEQVQQYVPPPPAQQTMLRTGSVTGNIVDKDNYLEALKRIHENQLLGRQKLAERAASLSGQADQLRKADMPVDLSALGALSDTLFGTNIAGHLKPTETKQTRAAELQSLQELLAKTEGKISDADLELLKTQLSGAQRTDEIQMRKDLAKLAGREKDEYRDEKRQAKEDALIEAQTTAISKRKEPLTGIVANLSSVDNILKRYPEGTLIPGYSSTDKVTPNWALNLMGDKEGLDLRQKVETIKSDVIKYYSGASASEKEVQRLAEGLGTKITQGPEQLREGLSELSKKMKEADLSIEAGYRPEAVKRYEERGGKTHKVFEGFDFGKASKEKSPQYKVGDTVNFNGVRMQLVAPDASNKANWVEVK